jgi:hypothetical protein
VLVALIGFAAHEELHSLVATTQCLDTALYIIQHYDLPFKRLAGATGHRKWGVGVWNSLLCR